MNTQLEAKLPPVTVVEVKPTADEETMQLRLQQVIPNEIGSSNNMLAVLMAGHSSFQSNPGTRTVYQNFSTQSVAQMGLTVGSSLPANLNAKIVIHEFLEGDTIPEAIKATSQEYRGKSQFSARTWIDKASGQPVKQQPKKAGRDGADLTKGGQPIYRNNYLVIGNMCHDDIFVQHDNTITRTVRANAEAVAGIAVGDPTLGEGSLAEATSGKNKK